MAYGLKYTSEFDSIKPLQAYSVNIFQKDYTGDPITVLLSGTPAIQEWQEDDPKAPIRGCTLRVSILTDVNGVRLTDFYSEDDNGFYVELRCTITDQYLFKGYLLQDDCKELQLDFNHEISLLFTDMLGTLKDVTLDQAAVISGQIANHSVLIGTSPGTLNTITTQDVGFGGLQPGAVFTINDGSLAGTYTVLSVSLIPTLGVYDYWIVTNQIIGYTLPYTASIDWVDPYPLVGYIPIIDVLKLCLKATFLDMRLKSVVSIYPIDGANGSTWDDTYIDANTLRVDTNSWNNCYDILEQIMTRFNTSLFQANAMWNIVRWDEMYRYTTITGANLFGSNYNNDFVLYASGSIQSDIFSFMDGNDMETGVMKSIERPLQFVKETFNYVQPVDLLCNSNLQDLGTLINQYDSGLYTIREYELNSWYDGPFTPIPDRFIRITLDNDPSSRTYKQELDRNIVVVNATGSAPQSIKSCDIAISKGDSIEFDFSFRTSVHQAGPVSTIFAISITDGTTTYYVQSDGTWATVLGYVYNTPNGADTFDWQTVNIISKPTPIDGIINVYLAEATSNGGTPSSDETLYKDLTFNVAYLINDSGKIIGHTHRDSQSTNIKNNITKDIYLDNSPRQSIKGTLFEADYVGLLRKRTNIWKYPGIVIDPVANLGIATTQESLFTRFKPRAKYEGNYLKVLQGNGPYEFVTPLSMFKQYGNEEIYRFVPGKMAIDYKNANVDLTLYELIDNMGYNFNGGLTAVYLEWAATKLYEFNYLFEN
jgi:hypothetical protein